VLHDPRVERVTRDPDPFGPEDQAWFTGAVGRADRDQGEVARAPAEVGDEDRLVVIEPGLVVVGGGDRLELEDDVGPTGGPE
jgi:hypothetical protein